MNVSLQQLLEMPQAAILSRQLVAALDNEQAERQRFYEIVEENQKMEFINGEIIFHSPVKKEHNSATGKIYKLLDTFADKYVLGYVGIEKILVSLTRNDYEPDVCFFGQAKATNLKRGQMRFPAPDLAVEVLSPSTEKYDRETKFQDYAAHGVGEYWVIDADREIVEQYFLQNERYELLLKASNGTIKSVVLPEFEIPVRAIFDAQTNLEVLGKILAA